MKNLLQSTLFIFTMTLSAAWGSDYQVMFETTSCSGESGFATAKVEDIYKIENAGCNVPGKPSEKLKQILVKNSIGSYDTFTLTQDESKMVISDMKMYMKARLKALENAKTLIIDKDH